jgi:tellurite resistance protein TehA-like permease
MLQPARSTVVVPIGLLAVGLVVLGGLFVLSLVGLVLEPAPIFVIDAAATGYCFTTLALVTRRRVAHRADETADRATPEGGPDPR